MCFLQEVLKQKLLCLIIIQPLGLSQRRAKSLKKMSYEFIHKDWKDDPTKLYGIGKYASDAYRIFVLNDWKDVQPNDGALVNYVNWRRENEHVRIGRAANEGCRISL